MLLLFYFCLSLLLHITHNSLCTPVNTWNAKKKKTKHILESLCEQNKEPVLWTEMLINKRGLDYVQQTNHRLQTQ